MWPTKNCPPKTMLYPRDPSLDPQLVWKGKDEQDREDLAVPVVPIYIQEKIHPQAIIDALPRIEKAGDTPDQSLCRLQWRPAGIRPEGGILPAPAELDQSHDSGRFAAGDDIAGRKGRTQRQGSNRFILIRLMGSSLVPTGR